MNRTAEGLRSCIARLEELGGFEPDPTDVDELEVADIVTVAGLIADAALLRGESRGCHSRLDAPARDDANWRKRVLLRRGAEPAFLPVDEEADDVRTP
jgi:L-aspartate oxidase